MKLPLLQKNMKKKLNKQEESWKNKLFKIWPPMGTPVNIINKLE